MLQSATAGQATCCLTCCLTHTECIFGLKTWCHGWRGPPNVCEEGTGKAVQCTRCEPSLLSSMWVYMQVWHTRVWTRWCCSSHLSKPARSCGSCEVYEVFIIGSEAERRVAELSHLSIARTWAASCCSTTAASVEASMPCLPDQRMGLYRRSGGTTLHSGWWICRQWRSSSCYCHSC